MTWELVEPYFVLVLLVVVFATMVTERFRVDVVSMCGVCLLLVTGVLSTKEVLAVFSNEAPITVAAMFVLSAALERTGVVEKAGHLLSRYASGSPLMGMFTLTAGAATVSAFMNNTPVVVILTPGRDRAGPLDRAQRLEAPDPALLCHGARRHLQPDRHLDQHRGRRCRPAAGHGRRSACSRSRRSASR